MVIFVKRTRQQIFEVGSCSPSNSWGSGFSYDPLWILGRNPNLDPPPPPDVDPPVMSWLLWQGIFPKAQAWRVSSLQLLLSRWWEDLGCRPLGLKPLKLMCLQLDLPVWQVWQELSRKRDTEHRINPFNKDGLGAPVFCCLGLNLEVHLF